MVLFRYNQQNVVILLYIAQIKHAFLEEKIRKVKTTSSQKEKFSGIIASEMGTQVQKCTTSGIHCK